MAPGGQIHCNTCRIQRTVRESSRSVYSANSGNSVRSSNYDNLFELGRLLGLAYAEGIKTKQAELAIRERELNLLEKQMRQKSTKK